MISWFKYIGRELNAFRRAQILYDWENSILSYNYLIAFLVSNQYGPISLASEIYLSTYCVKLIMAIILSTNYTEKHGLVVYLGGKQKSENMALLLVEC